ncbi:hypothetical protein DNTS_032806, partial [Danionella cerebrum]
MASGSRSDDGGDVHERTQLQTLVVINIFNLASVSCARLRRRRSWFGTAVFVEVTSEGESSRTHRSHSSSSPVWDERLTLSVSPHAPLEFRVLSHHALKADALLGRASLDLTETLRQHQGKLECVCEVLPLTLDGKNGSVSTGELTVFLDGLSIDPSLTPSTAETTVLEVQQNGDAVHESLGEPSATQNSRAVNGTDIAEDEAPPPSISTDCSPAPLVNGDSQPTLSHLCPSLKAPSAPPPESEESSSTVNGETSCSCPNDSADTADGPPAAGVTAASSSQTVASSEGPSDGGKPAPPTPATTVEPLPQGWEQRKDPL